MFEKLKKIYASASPDLRVRLRNISLFLLFLNGFVWVTTLIVWTHHPVLLGLVVLSYGLGLRHAVDADHIAAIDNATRKLMQDGKRPVAVGLFFSLGHSTIVILLCILVAFSASFVKQHLPFFEETGSFIGASISSLFLLIIGGINLLTLLQIIGTWRKLTSGKKISKKEIHTSFYTKGIMTAILTPLLKTLNNSYKMYFVGFLFGLGFDTASEIGLLSIAAASGASGMPIFEILLLPLAFTAGMTLIDTIDGVLMLGAYGWAYIKPIRKLYYNMNITFVSVVVALFIGGIEAMQILIEKLQIRGGFFDFIASLDFGNLGYIIIGIFILSWVISVGVYKYKGYDGLDFKR